MRVGLFFGSFDPPHIGHVNVVTGVINSGLVNQVLIIPAYQNVWKEHSTRFSYRYAMCCMAFDNLPNVSVSDIEKAMFVPSYHKGIPSYDVLTELSSRMTDKELVIITTPETYSEILNWHKGSEILNGYKFIMVINGAETPDDLPENVSLVYVPQIRICSTCIRNRVKAGMCIQPFIKDNVEALIKQYHLYV